MVLVFTGCAVGVTVPDRRQDRELVLGPVVVADIGCQQDIGRWLVGPLDGGGVPLAPGDLIGIGGVGQRRAGHHGQLHRCSSDGGASRNGGHVPAPANQGGVGKIRRFRFLHIHEHQNSSKIQQRDDPAPQRQNSPYSSCHFPFHTFQ